MKLSVITPVYKGEGKLKEDFFKKYKYLKKTFGEDFELIYVFDGKEKNSSLEIENIKKELNLKNLIYIKRDENKGKGYSVREGFNMASGEYLCFIDFDPEVPVPYINKMLKELEKSNNDLCIGNRFSKDSIYKVSIFRKILSIGFLWLNKILFGKKFPDSQAGLKMIKNSAYQLIKPKLESDRFAFDIEFIMMALRENIKFISIPIEYIRNDNISTIDFKTPINMAKESLKIWKRLKE